MLPERGMVPAGRLRRVITPRVHRVVPLMSRAKTANSANSPTPLSSLHCGLLTILPSQGAEQPTVGEATAFVGSEQLPSRMGPDRIAQGKCRPGPAPVLGGANARGQLTFRPSRWVAPGGGSGEVVDGRIRVGRLDGFSQRAVPVRVQFVVECVHGDAGWMAMCAVVTNDTQPVGLRPLRDGGRLAEPSRWRYQRDRGAPEARPGSRPGSFGSCSRRRSRSSRR